MDTITTEWSKELLNYTEEIEGKVSLDWDVPKASFCLYFS